MHTLKAAWIDLAGSISSLGTPIESKSKVKGRDLQ